MNQGLYQPGEPLPDGYANYRDVRLLPDQGYTRYWDAQARAPWLYDAAGQKFWTYDDPQSLAEKARYIREQRLGGVMFWEISGDDDQGTLVNTLYRELNA